MPEALGDGVHVLEVVPGGVEGHVALVDERDEVEALAGVRTARVVLREHVHEGEITEDVNARQHDAVEALLDAGLTPEQICGLVRGDLDLGADPAAVYLEKATATGRVTGPDDRLFATPEGDPLTPDRFELVHRRTRLAQVNMSGQTGICEGLNEARREKLDRPDPLDADADAH